MKHVYMLSCVFFGWCVMGGQYDQLMFRPCLQRVGFFSGPVWVENFKVSQGDSSNHVDLCESRIRLLSFDDEGCEFKCSYLLHSYDRELMYANLNLFAESVGTQSVIRCKKRYEKTVDDWLPSKFGIPISEGLLRVNLKEAHLIETYSKPIVIGKSKHSQFGWIVVNVFVQNEKRDDGYASAHLRCLDGRTYPICMVRFEGSDGGVFVAHKFNLDISVHPYVNVSKKLMLYLVMDGLELAVELCDMSNIAEGFN